MVATDAICFMPWIAAEYGLRLAEDYQVRPSCFKGVGDKEDFNRTHQQTSLLMSFLSPTPVKQDGLT